MPEDHQGYGRDMVVIYAFVCILSYARVKREGLVLS